jgi:hypothetical protein
LSMVEGKIYAIDDICTHEGGPLASLTDIIWSVHGIMLFLTLETGTYQMQRYGLLISTHML